MEPEGKAGVSGIVNRGDISEIVPQIGRTHGNRFSTLGEFPSIVHSYLPEPQFVLPKETNEKT